MYLAFLQLGQALKHPVAASAKPCRAELPTGSSRTDQAERGTQSSAGSRASAQRGWRNLFSDHKHLQDAQTISLPHWNEQIIFGGFSCPPAPQNSNSSRVWGCWGWGGLRETPAPPSAPLNHLSLGWAEGNWLRGTKKARWLYSQVKMSLRLRESPFPGEYTWSALKFALGYKEGNKFFACLQNWHFITLFSICLYQ